MKPTTIIFDVEGTLVDCMSHVLESWRVTLAEGGHTVSRSDLQRFCGMDGSDMLDRLLPEAGKSEKDHLLNAQTRAFPGVLDLIQRLKERRCLLAIATSCKGDELKAYDA